MKPVNNWFAEMSELMTQPTDAGLRKENSLLDSEFKLDEKTVEFVKNYSTSKAAMTTLDNEEPAEHEDSDVNMTNRIPAAEKGKGYWVQFRELVEQPALVVPLIVEPKKPTMVLKSSAGATLKRKRRERELDEQLENKRKAYQTLLAMKEELKLQIALKESALKAERALEKQKGLEAALRRSRAESHACRTSEPSSSKYKDSGRECPMSSVTQSKAAEMSKSVEDPTTLASIGRSTERVKSLTEELRKQDEGGIRNPGTTQPSLSTLKSTQLTRRSHARGLVSRECSGSGHARGKGVTQDTMSDPNERLWSPPSDSETSTRPSATLSSDESERGRKKKTRHRKSLTRKERQAAIKAVRINKPHGYHGEVIYNKYDTWIEDFRDWRDLHELNEYGTMVAMSMVLTGEAKEWYNLNVRGNERDWHLEDVSEAMFEDIFPDNFASVLRRTFEGAKQNDASLKIWYKYLMKLSKRVQYVNEHELCRRFWQGSATYLQKEWAKIGLREEDTSTTVEVMLESGLRFERARGYELATERQTSFNSRGLKDVTPKAHPNDYLYNDEQPLMSQSEQNRQKNEEGDSSETYQSSENETSDGGHKSKEDEYSTEEEEHTSDAPREDEAVTSEGPNEDEVSDEGHNPEEDADPTDEGNSTKYRRDQMRMKGRCFECGRQGHIARNCPQRNANLWRMQDDETLYVYNASLLSDSEGASDPESEASSNTDTSEMSALMGVGLWGMKIEQPQHQQKAKGNRQRVYKCENSSEGDDSPGEVMEPKRGRGRLRKSVLSATIKPTEEPTSRESNVVLSASEESERDDKPTEKRRGEDDKPELLRESVSQMVTQSDPRMHCSIYHIQHDSSVRQNPECVGKKHQDRTSLPFPDPNPSQRSQNHIILQLQLEVPKTSSKSPQITRQLSIIYHPCDEGTTTMSRTIRQKTPELSKFQIALIRPSNPPSAM
jgi:hypothetical protein